MPVSWKRFVIGLGLLISVAFLFAEEEGARKRLAEADQDKNGKLTLSEFKTVAPNPKRAEKAFERFDTDKDGSLSKAELKDALKALAAKTANAATPDPAKTETPELKGVESKPAADQRNSKRDPKPVAAAIDHEITRELAKNKIPASPLATDAEFLRRLSLDLRGRIPSLDEAEHFLNDTNPDKRRHLIDQFLADEEYGEHFAIIWYHRIAKPDDDNQRALVRNQLQGWLAEGFNHNRGWDGIVRDILTASGERDQNPAITFWLTAIGDAKLGQPEPAKATAAASRLFMGVRLECCECHNHPFTTLKQTDFWGTAAFFTQTHARNANQQAAKAAATPAVLEQAGFNPKRKKKADPEDNSKPAPFGSIAIPYGDGQTVEVKFLGGDSPQVEGESKLRPIFADWLTASSNPYFARAAANKLWANFFGRGIVDPIDDMQPESPNTHPELLTLLANEFVASEFDQKHLIRCICNSQTYQRSSEPLPENKSDESLYAKMPLKIMTADMLYDSLATALGHKVSETGDKRQAKGRKYGGGPRDEFRKFFHAEADDDAGVVADYTHGVPQVLRLMNARQINDTTATVAALMKAEQTPDKIISSLYLTVLTREPTAGELKQAREFIAQDKDAANGYGDLMWALLNSSEFLFNH